MNSNKTWKMYVIHHSHTDIGYTERQEKIEWHHIEYIKEVIDILNDAYKNNKKEWQGFKWNCESFWCVEKFLNEASENYKKDFIKYVNQGNIGISGSYLNLTDLVSEEVLREVLGKTMNKTKELGIDVKSAMTADINGYGFGFSEILYDNGIRNLYSCVHTHHGMFPLGRKQIPFYWETPKGNKVLVWNGEHYHIGNELGVSGFKGWSYMIQDGLDNKPLSLWETAEIRLLNYIRQLEKDDYPFDFVSVTVSGLMTDNAPPSTRVIEFINKWNSVHGNELFIEMATIDDVFNELQKHSNEIETFRGDWTDWWADGVGSTPNAVKHFKEAQRRYEICKLLDPENKIGSKELMDTALQNLIIYAEHTWGFSASITDPCHTMVNTLDLRKTSYASRAHECVSRNLDKITISKGETALRMDKNIKFKLVNPYDKPVKQIAKFYLEILFGHENFEIIEEITEKSLPYQIENVPRGFEINVLIDLEAKEEKTLVFKDIVDNDEFISTSSFSECGSDGIRDLSLSFNKEDFTSNVYRIETSFFNIKLHEKEGIVSFFDKTNNKELVRKHSSYNAFTPIYEVTPVKQNQGNDRRIMGRNRKSVHTNRYIGEVTDIRVISKGRLFTKVELEYTLKGTTYCSIIITAYNTIPRVDVALKMNKESVWEPENVYIALPFTTGEEKEQLWIDKTASILRPRIDQLPGTCVDFYALQNGASYTADNRSLIIAMPDTPLITMGDLKSHEIKFCGEEGLSNTDELYSWVMNNFWETNFKASLGGFHEYNYSVYLAEGADEKAAFDYARIMNGGILCFNRWE